MIAHSWLLKGLVTPQYRCTFGPWRTRRGYFENPGLRILRIQRETARRRKNSSNRVKRSWFQIPQRKYASHFFFERGLVVTRRVIGHPLGSPLGRRTRKWGACSPLIRTHILPTVEQSELGRGKPLGSRFNSVLFSQSLSASVWEIKHRVKVLALPDYRIQLCYLAASEPHTLRTGPHCNKTGTH